MSNADTKSNAADAASTEAQQAVGQLLRQTREKAGLDIAEVARVLRISQRYLDALEDGRNQDLPGAAYAIGFVRSYAEHLKLDGEEIVRRYKAEAQGVGVKSDLIFPKPIPDSGVPGAAVLGLGAIVAAVAYGVWYYNSNSDDMTVVRVEPVPEHMAASDSASADQAAAEAAQAAVEAAAEAAATVDVPGSPAAEEPGQESGQEAVESSVAPVEDAAETAVAEASAVEVAPEIAAAETPAVEAPAVEAPAPEVVQEAAPAPEPEPVAEPVAEAVAEPAPEPVAEPVTEAVAAAPAAASDTSAAGDEGPSRITVRAKSNSWIQVRDEALDRLLFTRLLREGDEYEVPDRPGLRLMTGNAGALELLVDGEAIAAIGEVGEVRRNVELDPDKLKAGTAVTE